MYIEMQNPDNGVVIQCSPKFIANWMALGFHVVD